MNCNYRLWFRLAVILMLFTDRAVAADSSYDPLAVAARRKTATIEFTVNDAEQRREIPMRIYLPEEKSPSPVVLFSHGLGGSRDNSAYLGKHWAARGYVAVFLQHPGSDTSVWQGLPFGQRLGAMQKAANLRNFLLRVQDVTAVLDQLERWNKPGHHPLTGRLDLKRLGMSGHSFGAVTTQAVSGQVFRHGKVSFTDGRIKAAIAFSPNHPRREGNPQVTFGRVNIPWLLMTGTKDLALIGDADLKSRLAVFPALPPGGKYELVLHGAEHSAFSERPLPGDTAPRNPNHHRVILALSTAFWDAWLREDPAARAWLDGDGPSTLLEKDDRWQKK